LFEFVSDPKEKALRVCLRSWRRTIWIC